MTNVTKNSHMERHYNSHTDKMYDASNFIPGEKKSFVYTTYNENMSYSQPGSALQLYPEMTEQNIIEFSDLVFNLQV